MLIGSFLSLTINTQAGPNKIGGTKRDDVLKGGNRSEVLNGGAGDDIPRGGGGNDTLNCQAGNDALFGGPGNDTLNGGPGADGLYGQGGDDNYLIVDSSDFVSDEAGNNVVYLSEPVTSYASSRFNGVLTFVAIDGLIFTDKSILGAAPVVVTPPVSVPQPQPEPLPPVDTNDVLIGTVNNDNFDGQGGDDFISGEGGSDIINGGAGNDILFGGYFGVAPFTKADPNKYDNDDVLIGGTGFDFFIPRYGSINPAISQAYQIATRLYIDGTSTGLLPANLQSQVNIVDFESGIDKIGISGRDIGLIQPSATPTADDFTRKVLPADKFVIVDTNAQVPCYANYNFDRDINLFRTAYGIIDRADWNQKYRCAAYEGIDQADPIFSKIYYSRESQNIYVPNAGFTESKTPYPVARLSNGVVPTANDFLYSYYSL